MADRSELYGSGFQYPMVWDSATGGISGASGIDSVRASLFRLFDTAPGEERFNPAYGCGLKTLLFEPDTQVLRALLDTVVRDAVAKWEPRIQQVLDVQVLQDPNNPNAFTLRVFFRLIQSQVVSNMVYPFSVQPQA